MTTAPVIHGHFYQPPRENPRTDSSRRRRELALALALAPAALTPAAPGRAGPAAFANS